MNPLLKNYPGATVPQVPDQLRDLYKLFTTSSNPYQIIQSMAAQNPQMAQIMPLLQKGMTPEQVAREICRARGIDADQFIKQLKNNNA